MENLYVKITIQDIDIASNFFENDKHLDEFLSNVARYYCKKPLTLKTKIVIKYFETYKKTMDLVIVNRINGKNGGLKSVESKTLTEKPLGPPVKPAVGTKLSKVSKLSKDKDSVSLFENPDYVKFNDWLTKIADRVLLLKKPFTEHEYLIIKKNIKDGVYSKDDVQSVLEAMQNKKSLLKDYESAYLTFNNWMKLRQQRKGGQETITKPISTPRHATLEEFNGPIK